MIKNFLNPEGHQNPFSGSKVTAILLKGWTCVENLEIIQKGIFYERGKKIINYFTKKKVLVRLDASH